MILGLNRVWQEMHRRLPAQLHGRRGKPVFVIALGLITFAVTCTIAIANPYRQSLTSLLVFGGILLVVSVSIYHGMSAVWGMSVSATAAIVHLFNVAMSSGGIYSPRVVWVSLLPMAFLYSAGPRIGRAWLWISLAVVCALAGWTASQAGLPTFVFGPGHAQASALSYLLATVVMMMVPWLYDLMNERQLALGRQRQKDLQAKQVELEHTQQMQESFIASVSHELRTPMNAILGLNRVLLEKVQGKPQARKVLEYTRQSADHLMTVINDVLDHSQFNTGQIQARVEKVALHDTVKAAFELFLPRIESTRLRYQCEIAQDVPRWVETDGHRLMQVLVNLLGNAIKFTHQGLVRLRVTSDGQGLTFEVQDTGIGIAHEQQQKIFERFGQADASIQSRYGGSGLGLTISQRLVQMLGGQLQLESHEGAGSRFWFRLPLTAVPAPRQPMAPMQEERAGQDQALRFLVVDDHPVNRLLVRQVLTRHWPKALVVEAQDGRQALQCLQGEAFDLVLMDMVMPEMDGIEATAAIRASANEHTRSTPVLGLTANVNTKDLQRFEQAGLDAVLLKPFDIEGLCAQVTQLVGQARQQGVQA